MNQPTIGAIWDPLVSLIKDVPGGQWVENAVSNGADFIGDMAKTTAGKLILVGITNAMLFPAVAGIAIPSVSGMQTLGPQIAAVVWAIPDVAAGGSFIPDLAAEITWRTESLAAAFGGNLLAVPVKAFLDGIRKGLGIPEVKTATQNVWQSFGATKGVVTTPLGTITTTNTPGLDQVSDQQLRDALAKANIDPKKVASYLGIREDSAAAALMGYMKRPLWDLNQGFNLDGTMKPGAEKGPTLSVILQMNGQSNHSSRTLTSYESALRWKSIDAGSVAFSPGPKPDFFSFQNVAILGMLTSPFWFKRVLGKVKHLRHR